MKIDSSTVGMESARSYRSTSISVRRFMIGEYRRGGTALNTAVGGNAGNSENAGGAGSAESAADRTSSALSDWQKRMQGANTNVSIRSSASQTYATIRQTTIHYIFSLLFGSRTNRFNQWLQDSGAQSNAQEEQQNANAGAEEQNAQDMQLAPLTTNVKVLRFTQENIQIESENTAFSTVGKVRTADGREIDFNVNVGMSRQFQQHFYEDLQMASFEFCDPLVINLDTDVAELSDQTFYFDIDADGELDEVSELGRGSGYLALDKNGDGVINDGSELFGTASGNGFADLVKYDEDGNGWIDENDAVWDQLKIWCKDENGKDVLYRLADKGVGAICLQNAATDFTLKGQSGQTQGAIRNTGVFLYENGNVGTVQHVDVAKYYAQA